MRKLSQRIKRELETAKHCAVYEEELSRVGPDDGNRREPKLARFAEEHGFRLRFYRDGLCAIFDKEPSSPRRKKSFSTHRCVSHAGRAGQSSAPHVG